MMQFDFSAVDWSDDDSSPFDQCEYTSGSSSSSSSSGSCDGSCPLRTPTVRFALEDEIFEIPHVNDFSDEHINAVWYRPDEFREMRNQVQQVVSSVIEQQRPQQPAVVFIVMEESDTTTMRGLEYRTLEGNTKRCLRKREAYAAVLEGQVQYRHDPERIAAAYEVVSTVCQGEAIYRGMKDSHDVRNYLLQETSSPSEQLPQQLPELPPIEEEEVVADSSLRLLAVADTTTTAEASCQLSLLSETSRNWRRALLEDSRVVLSESSDLNLCHHTSPAAA